MGSADIFVDFYSGFGSGWHWDSRKSCKYEGGELNYSRKIVFISFICISVASRARELLEENSRHFGWGRELLNKNNSHFDGLV